MNRLLRTAVATGGALIAVAGLAGCSGGQLGTAANVGGERISTRDLQEATQDYLAVVPQADEGEAQRQILGRYIFSEVVSAAAAEAGVGVPAGTVARQRDELLANPQVGSRKGLVQALAAQQPAQVLTPSYIDRWFTDRALYLRLADALAAGGEPGSPENIQAVNEALADAADTLDIEVNPRYGAWSAQGGITGLVSGGLSVPAEDAGAAEGAASGQQ